MARIFTRQEVRKRKMKYQVFAGMADFIGILLGLIVIAACVFLLVTLEFHHLFAQAFVVFKGLTISIFSLEKGCIPKFIQHSDMQLGAHKFFLIMLAMDVHQMLTDCL